MNIVQPLDYDRAQGEAKGRKCRQNDSEKRTIEPVQDTRQEARALAVSLWIATEVD